MDGVSLSLGTMGVLAAASVFARRGSRATNATPLILWHGAQRWQGPPELRPARKGQVEHGPGLYLTTSASTARKYAKGGGSVIRFEIDPELRWLEDARMLRTDMLRFLAGRSRLRKRKEIEADIERACARMGREDLPATVLLNLLVNHDALTGDHGPALAAFYVAHGIDASHVSRGDEDWIVLFNLDKVRAWQKVPAGQTDDAPRVVRSPKGSAASSSVPMVRCTSCSGRGYRMRWTRQGTRDKGTSTPCRNCNGRGERPALPEALVIVHLASLDSYYGQVDRKKPVEALGQRIAAAVAAHQGPVIVVSQDWPLSRDSGPRQVVEAAITARANGVYRIHHDESEDPDGGWDVYEATLTKRLRKLGVTKVRLAGLWYQKDEESGCVTETKRRLTRAGFDVRVDRRLVGYEEAIF